MTDSLCILKDVKHNPETDARGASLQFTLLLKHSVQIPAERQNVAAGEVEAVCHIAVAELSATGAHTLNQTRHLL